MKKITTFVLLAAFLLSLTACGERQEVFPAPQEPVSWQTAEIIPPQEPEELPAADSLEDRLDQWMAELSTEEKVGQLFFVRMPPEAEADDVSTYHLGGYVVFWRNIKEKNPAEMTALLSECQSAAKIPLFLGTDEEGGSVVRFSLNSQLRTEPFSSPRTVYHAGGLDALQADCAEKDEFLQQFGINVNLAPVADTAKDPDSFIYDRTVGDSPEETAECIRTMVEQMTADGMGTCLKHFPGYGDNLDTHTGIAVDERPYSQFETGDFLPFAAGIEAGAPFILVSHNIITCMDETLPASLSPAVHRILREALHFQGLIITDDLAMGAVAQYVSDGSAAAQAIRAGNDMIITTDYPTQISQVLAALEDGTLDMDAVDTACRNVLRVKMQMGLM